MILSEPVFLAYDLALEQSGFALLRLCKYSGYPLKTVNTRSDREQPQHDQVNER